ncbi:hypothetical protein [Paraburkholderia sp. SIMBA_053]
MASTQVSCSGGGVGRCMPQIIKGFPKTPSHAQVDLIAMVPYLF